MARASRPVLVLLVLCALAACGNRPDPDLILAAGHVEATDVRISCKVGGTLEWLPLEEGDRVAAGQPVARIDSVDLRLGLAAAQAERDQVRAELALRLAGERPEAVAEAEAQVGRAESELAGAQTELDRRQKLLDDGSGARKERDDALTRRDVAKSALTAARERYKARKTGFRKEEIDAARARFAAAEARIAQLRQQVRDCAVASPAGGVVTAKIAERGEIVPPGAPLLVVTDLDNAWLTVFVGEPDLDRVRLGQPVDVVTDAGQRRGGKIRYVASQAEFTPKNVQTRDERVKLVYRVKVGLDNRDGLFKPGMPATARMRAAAPPR